MTEKQTAAAGGGGGPAALPGRATTRNLLACGVLGGPLFIVVVTAQVLTRDGFDPKEHPLSLLSVGPLGWIQIANFVLAGALFIAAAVGMRRVLHPGRGGTWGPWLIGAFGVGLVWGGVFVVDPSLGYPPGTPPGIPDQQSWHSALHTVAPVAASLAVGAACLVFARRFAGLGQWGWAAYSVTSAVVGFALSSMAMSAQDFRLLFAGGAVTWIWASVMAARLMLPLTAPAAPIPAQAEPTSA